MEIKLQPLPIPRRVYADQKAVVHSDEVEVHPGFNISHVSPDELAELCDAFREGVFKTAGKHDPRKKSVIGPFPAALTPDELTPRVLEVQALERRREMFRMGAATLEWDAIRAELIADIAEVSRCRVEAVKRAEAAEAERDKLREMGGKVNAIRDSVIGGQILNWSEHIYPLVAALNAAGFVGKDYKMARENLGTLLENMQAAMDVLDRLEWLPLDDGDQCPVCGNKRDKGHTPTCALALALANNPKKA